MDPWSQFEVYDEQTEWIYDQGNRQAEYRELNIDPTKVAVPRKAIYLQGVLLMLVALACFALGMMVGSNSASRQISSGAPSPCIVSGRVSFRTQRGDRQPESEGVVILLPKDAHPQPKATIQGLRPTDNRPAENHSGIQALREIGGTFVRTNPDGTFRARLPDAGNYFVLFLSGSKRQTATEPPKKSDLAQIGRYFDSAYDLVANRAYAWKQLAVRSDRELKHVFE